MLIANTSSHFRCCKGVVQPVDSSGEPTRSTPNVPYVGVPIESLDDGSVSIAGSDPPASKQRLSDAQNAAQPAPLTKARTAMLSKLAPAHGGASVPAPSSTVPLASSPVVALPSSSALSVRLSPACARALHVSLGDRLRYVAMRPRPKENP
jgi:hypothetical protein